MSRWLPILAVLAGFGTSVSFAQYGIVDCIEQKRLAVRRVQGRVYDPNGVALEGALITLSSETEGEVQSKTNEAGEFLVRVHPGRYSFRATFPGFESTRANVEVGFDVISVVHPTALHVILALPGVNCPWVTTSNKEFKGIVHKHATQK
jgi:hypothetical protein